MILKIETPSLFISQKKLKSISAEYGWPVCRFKEWLKVNQTPVVCSAVMTSMDSLAVLASVNKMNLEALEGFLVDYVVRGKKIRGIGCQDCILVHPRIVGEALWKLIIKKPRGITTPRPKQF